MIPHICRIISASVKTPAHAFELAQVLGRFLDVEHLEKCMEFFHGLLVNAMKAAGQVEQVIDEAEAVMGQGTPAEVPGEPSSEQPPVAPAAESTDAVPADTKSDDSTNHETQAESDPAGETPAEEPGQGEPTAEPVADVAPVKAAKWKPKKV